MAYCVQSKSVTKIALSHQLFTCHEGVVEGVGEAVGEEAVEAKVDVMVEAIMEAVEEDILLVVGRLLGPIESRSVARIALSDVQMAGQQTVVCSCIDSVRVWPSRPHELWRSGGSRRREEKSHYNVPRNVD